MASAVPARSGTVLTPTSAYLLLLQLYSTTSYLTVVHVLVVLYYCVLEVRSRTTLLLTPQHILRYVYVLPIGTFIERLPVLTAVCTDTAV